MSGRSQSLKPILDIDGERIDTTNATGIGAIDTIKDVVNYGISSNIKTHDKCEKLSILHFIGKQTDIQSNKYNSDCDSIHIPLINLPCVYFPFYYDTVETSINNIKKLVPMLEYKYNNDMPLSCSFDPLKTKRNENVQINKENLIFAISNIMEKKQPYNNKNIYYITIFVFIFWIIIILSLLKILYVKFIGIYTYIIIGLTISLLLFCSIWALVITSQNI